MNMERRMPVTPGMHAATDPAFSFAFLPIVDTVARKVFSYEALIRGPGNEPASAVLKQVAYANRHRFNQDGRAVAIALAVRLGIECHLNLNFLPRSLHSLPGSIVHTLEAADRCGLARQRIILEVTEVEAIDNHVEFAQLINEHRSLGLKVAIDDFGAGYSGLNLLADFQPDQIKLDMNLVRGIESRAPRQAIVRAIAQACRDLGIEVIAEGVETEEEYRWFADQGVRLFQGYLFARPAFESFPPVHYPD
jgi:EAL domain-containing protein (putative c-di-GMP-specific phosphodiesterase class I)